MGRGQANEGDLFYGEASPRRDASPEGINGKPVLLPLLPGDDGVAVLERALVTDIVRAYFDMGPDERKTRNVGVLRYLMHLLRPGFEQEDVRLQDLDDLLSPVTEGPEVEVRLTDAEWRSVHRVLELGHDRDMRISAASAEQAMRRLFGVGPGEIDIEVACSRCGFDVGSQDARIVRGVWVGEVCCLGRSTTVPAEAFPEDAVNFGALTRRRA